MVPGKEPEGQNNLTREYAILASAARNGAVTEERRNTCTCNLICRSVILMMRKRDSVVRE